MGTLKLPMPEMGKGVGSLASQASALEERIRAQLPKELRDTVTVRPRGSGAAAMLWIEFDDRAEQMVLVALEYPAGSGKQDCAAPTKKTRRSGRR